MTPTIDFISDVICPWCFIGLRRLESALAEEGAAGAAITFHPFQLDPSTPPEGADLRERLAGKFGGDPEPMFRKVEAAARESGIPLDFAKVRRTPNTLSAHTLITRAHEKGTQRALAGALFEAYFLEGKDVGSRDVLVEIAAGHGFAKAEARDILEDRAALDLTRTEAHAMSSQGIRGVPFTIFAGKLAVSGAQPTSAFRDVFRRARAAE
ncbi:MAG: DsbA family oxidoreductase [Labilithrix sp.]|nr:DsbA family oxidoreductase [Labilithrix sp.]MCW5833478.1 DsbA family oxidoreductase [Labilithrix sp.]